MHTLPSLTGHHLSPRDLSVVRRVFEATCLKTRLQERGIQADRLARFIMDEFRFGNTDEVSLLECALWHETRRIPSKAKNHSVVDIRTARTREGRDPSQMRKAGAHHDLGAR
ncbi:hypothetical protein AC244_33095 [Ensifer adhaerens]|uniref:Uncharacterized protein n=1 Tax=Ensifer adhaerens TaxID=106592 RepID=A0A0L8BE16_ENSAD|nr:hypothetical protein [Ensifer adhaerens]KOF12848.1 hypothetical protein AC244_33095 [Ensifer adhaerens]